jgi:two-component system chemotaxis sensor kinase CheA
MTKDGGFNEELLQIFMVEALEQLDKFTQTLLSLEKDPDNIDDLNELFRIAHSLKGTSGMVGYDDLKESMHAAEDLMDAARSGRFKLSAEEFDLLLALGDAVTQHLTESAELSKDDWVERIRRPLEGSAADGNAALPEPALVLNETEKLQISSSQEQGKSVYGFELRFSNEAPLRSVTAKVFLNLLQELSEIFKTAPDAGELIDENYSCLKVVVVTEHELSEEEFERLSRLERSNPGVESLTWRQWVYHPAESEKAARFLERGDKTTAADTIRVDSQKLQKLLNTVGDLLSVRASLDETVASGTVSGPGVNSLKLQMYQFNQTLSSLQTEVMQLRMVPIQQLFGRYPRIVRDLAHKSGKEVELRFQGEGTEIDKKVMELLVDPLTHLIRNSVDHGIEDKEVRLAHNKPPVGKVTLNAVQEGNNIVIEICDDGSGIDPEKIQAKAIEKGIAQADKSYSQDEIYEFMFAPGFSTSDKITEISGRGVGLDVVRTNLAQINGSVTVQSSLGEGTVFRLSVPLTLAIINAFLVRVAGQVFAVPAHDVIENIVISADDLHNVENSRMIRLREEIIPIVDAGDLFYASNMECSTRQPVVILGNRHKKAGLIVDEFLEPREIMIKPVNPALGQIDYVSGVTVLGNGNVALIVDVGPILQSFVRKAV